jgi:hypothetical protein
MTAILTEYQEVTDLLHYEGVGKRKRQESLSSTSQGFLTTMAASVVYVVAATPGAEIFDSANNGAEKLMGLVQATNDDDAFTESLAGLGKRTVAHLRNLYDAVSDQGSGLRVHSADRAGEVRSASAPLTSIREGLRIIRMTSPLPTEEHEVYGRLVSANVDSRRFGLRRDRPEKGRRRYFNGTVGPEVDMEQFRLGKSASAPLYRALILEEQEESLYTQSRWRSRFTLTEIEPVDVTD